MCSRKKGGEWISSDSVNPYLPKFNSLGYKCFQNKKVYKNKTLKKRINLLKESVVIRKKQEKKRNDCETGPKHRNEVLS